jgi:hypothetical protein
MRQAFGILRVRRYPLSWVSHFQAYPHFPCLFLHYSYAATRHTVPPSKDAAYHTQAVYTAAHKALCTLAFALQEVTQHQNEKDTSHT